MVMIMSRREVRPVAIGWEHPRSASGACRELFSRADLLRDLKYRETHPEAEPDPDNYMPAIPEGAPYSWVLYETHTPGTPLSPAFSSLEELADWSAENETISGSIKWSREQWLAAFQDGGPNCELICEF